jgi:hypothetical protein
MGLDLREVDKEMGEVIVCNKANKGTANSSLEQLIYYVGL